jgi:hypothetical protein
VKTFSEIQSHSSYRAVPPKVQEVLRIALRDPANVDLLAALKSVSPKAVNASRDVQLDTIRKILTIPKVQTLLAWAVFGIDLSELEDVPALPNGQGDLLR